MKRLIVAIGALGALFLGATALGFALLVLLFKSGLFAGMTILFYRGVVLAVLAAVMTGLALALAAAKLRIPAIRPRDAVAAAIASFSLNIAFLVVVPVTVDRSISVFVLGRLAVDPGLARGADNIRQGFVDGYVIEQRQIERRIDEQLLSGNLERDGDGYRISQQGLAFVRAFKAAAWLFDADRRLVDPKAPSPPATSPAR